MNLLLKKFFYQTVLVTSLILSLFINKTYASPGQVEVELKNPLKVSDLNELLEAILGVVIVLATPIIVFFIIYAGFLYVTARGNAEQVKKATQALTYAIIGGVIILGSVAIAAIVKNLVSAFQ